MNDNAIGRSWDEARTQLFTFDEIEKSNFRVDMISEVIKARQEQKTDKSLK